MVSKISVGLSTLGLLIIGTIIIGALSFNAEHIDKNETEGVLSESQVEMLRESSPTYYIYLNSPITVCHVGFPPFLANTRSTFKIEVSDFDISDGCVYVVPVSKKLFGNRLVIPLRRIDIITKKDINID